MLKNTNPSELSYDQFSELVEMFQRGLFGDVTETGQKLINEFPDALKLQNLVGSAYAQLGEFEKSIEILRKVIAKDIEYANAHHNLGLSYSHVGQLDSAVEMLMHAIYLSPYTASFHHSLASTFFAKGDLKNAIAAQKSAVDLDGSCARFQTALGGYYMAIGRLDLARTTLENVLNALPGESGPMVLLGQTYTRLNMQHEAMAQFDAAQKICPDDPELLMAMAKFWRKYASPEKELEALEKMHKNDPDDPELQYFLPKLAGEKMQAAPAAYVTKLFDQYAENFENSMRVDLNYQCPIEIAAVLTSHLPSSGIFDEVIDLGCGTGLVGEAIAGMAHRISGVDLSGNMIAQAKCKGIYDNLSVGDIVDAVRCAPQQYDLYIAADVFIYIGDLASLFSAMRRNAKKGALFIFTTESQEKPGFEILPSGRYAHSRDYVTTLCAEHFIDIVSIENIDLRKEGDAILTGDLYAAIVQ